MSTDGDSYNIWVWQDVGLPIHVELKYSKMAVTIRKEY